jgi:DNA-binding transcriptional LysR family regulator
MNLVQEILYEILETVSPSSLLCVASEAAPSSVQQFQAHHPDCRIERVEAEQALAELKEMGRFDYAVLSRALEPLAPEDGAALIARVRDIHCHRFALACRHTDAHHREGEWSEPELLSLALKLHRRVREDGVWHSVYTYDVDSYNRKRDWNSPENWANPENFRRYRW